MEESAPLLRDVIEWDVENWSRALAFWRRSLPRADSLECLELGARRGGLSLWLALQGHRVICSDLQDNRTVAAPLHEAYGVADRVTYEAIDATQIPYENRFDVIAFKSMLGGVAWDGDAARQARAVQSIYSALRPGGVLLFAENLRGSPLHQLLRRRFVTWNDVWRYVTIEEMLGYFTPFSNVDYDTTGFLGLLGRTPQLSRAFGKIDGAIFDRLAPRSMRYIMFGAARK